MILIIYFLCCLNIFAYSRTEIKSEGNNIFTLLNSGDYGGDNLNKSIVDGEGEVTLSISAKIDNLLSGSGKVNKIEVTYNVSKDNIRDEEEELICKVNGDISFIKFDSLGRSFYKDLNRYKSMHNIFKIHNGEEGPFNLGIEGTFVLANRDDNEKNSFYFKSKKAFIQNRCLIDIEKLNEKAEIEFDIDGNIAIVSSRDLYKFFIPIHIPKRAMQHNLRHKITFNIKIFYDNEVVDHVHDFVFGNRSSNLSGKKMIIVADSHDAEYKLCIKNDFDEYSNILLEHSLHSSDIYKLDKDKLENKIWCFELADSNIDDHYEVVTADGQNTITTISESNGISIKSYLIKLYSVNDNGEGGQNRALISSIVIDLYIISANRYVAPVFNSYSPKYFEYEGEKLGVKNNCEIRSIDKNMNVDLGTVSLLNSDLNYKLIPKLEDLNILCSSLTNIPNNRVDSNEYIFSDRDEVKIKVKKANLYFDTSNVQIVEMSYNGRRKIILQGLKVNCNGKEYTFADDKTYSKEIVHSIWSSVNITYPDIIDFDYKITYKIRNWYFLDYDENKSIDIDYDIDIPFEESVAIFPIIKRKDGDKYVGYMNFVKREFYKKGKNIYNFIIYEGDNSNASLKWKSNDLDNIPFDLDLTHDILSKLNYVNDNKNVEDEHVKLSFCKKIDYSFGRLDSFHPNHDIIINANEKDIKIMCNEDEIARIGNDQFILLPSLSKIYPTTPQYSVETSNINMIFNNRQFCSGVIGNSHIVDIWCNPSEFDNKKRVLSTDNKWLCAPRSFSILKQIFFINNIFFTKGESSYSAKISFEGIVIKKSPLFTKTDEAIEEQISCNVKFVNEDDMDKHIDNKFYNANNNPLTFFNNPIINIDKTIPFNNFVKIPFQIKVVKNIRSSFSSRSIDKLSLFAKDDTTHCLSKEGLLTEYDKDSKKGEYFLKLGEQNNSFERYIDKSIPLGFKLGYQVDAIHNDKLNSSVKRIKYLVLNEHYDRRDKEIDRDKTILLKDSTKHSDKDRILYNKINIQNREIKLEDKIDIGYSIESSEIILLSLSFNIDKDIFNTKFPYSLVAHKLSLYILPYEYSSGSWQRVQDELAIDIRSYKDSNCEGVDVVKEVDIDTFKEKNILRREEAIFEHPKAELFIDNPKYLLSQTRTNIRAGFSYRYDEKYNNDKFEFTNSVSYNSDSEEKRRKLELFNNGGRYNLNPGLYISYFAIYNSSKDKILELDKNFMEELIKLGDKKIDSLEIYSDRKYDFVSISFDEEKKKYILSSKDSKFKLHVLFRYFENDIYLPSEIFLEDIYIHQSIIGEKMLFKMEGQMFVNSDLERDENRRKLKVDEVETESTILITKIRGI